VSDNLQEALRCVERLRLAPEPQGNRYIDGHTAAINEVVGVLTRLISLAPQPRPPQRGHDHHDY
jgi:hypothetical protein